ncbi:hypothetical protein K8Z23_30870 (plasmid) [Bacillus thuringiensis]|nr:hypothetical protein [Bacillus thuringiensis]UEL01401.1 hypothetical protein K8Z23_30870 [Bacillus thuringiensis]
MKKLILFEIVVLLLYPITVYLLLNRIMLFVSAYKISKFKRVNLDG